MTAANMRLALTQKDHLSVNATTDTMGMVVRAKVIDISLILVKVT